MQSQRTLRCSQRLRSVSSSCVQFLNWVGLPAHDRTQRALRFSSEAVSVLNVQTGWISIRERRECCTGVDDLDPAEVMQNARPFTRPIASMTTHSPWDRWVSAECSTSATQKLGLHEVRLCFLTLRALRCDSLPACASSHLYANCTAVSC